MPSIDARRMMADLRRLAGCGWRYPLSAMNARRAHRSSTREVVIGARHSTIEVHADDCPGAVPGRVYTVEPTGDITYAHVYVGSTIVVVSVTPGMTGLDRLRSGEDAATVERSRPWRPDQ
jgi:ABC-type sugar transport system ATPase subunit